MKYEHILKPLTVGPLTFKNRIVSSPTSIALLDDNGRINDNVIAYYEQKAAGGCAVVTVGESIVRIADGRSHPRQIPLDDPGEYSGLSRLASAIHAHGAYASIQLSHGGGLCPPDFVGGEAIGPSEIIKDAEGTNGHPSPFYSKVRMLSVQEIEELAEAYGKAAAVVKRLGFDMCMVHGGHGWLLHQFISEKTNLRTDEYGGSLENRMRFPLLVIEKIREHTGGKFPIEFRMSGSERCEDGYGIETGIAIAKILDGKVDLIHVSAGTQESAYSEALMHPTVFQKHGENVCYAAEIKKHVKTPVVTVGALSDPDAMEEILASGQADILALGRGLIADPYLPKKLMEGRGEDVVCCLRCHECFNAMMTRDDICCTVNPSIGREIRFMNLKPSKVSKKVLIAGGGPAGMAAAITAAKRGHKVTLCEKTGNLGGMLHGMNGVETKKQILRLLQQMEREVKRLPIELRLNTAVTESVVAKEKPDVLFAAVGAHPVVPPIAGIENEFVTTGAGLNPSTFSGKRVVIIGGGLVGCELAVELCQNGNEVTLLGHSSSLAKGAPRFHFLALMEEMKKIKAVRTGMQVKSITESGVVATPTGGDDEFFPADIVVIACGLKSAKELDRLRDFVPMFIPIGDYEKPAKIGTAIRQAVDMVIDMDF